MQDWSWIPVGGSLPNTEQKNLAFGAAACMVHPATGKCWFGLFGIVICILYRMSVSNCLKAWYPSDLILEVFSLPLEI